MHTIHRGANDVTTGSATISPPEQPGGRITLQPPPELREREGVSGVLMNVVPMLGSLGAIALVATTGGAGASRGRSYLAAGLFLFATLGFVLVQVERQRRQRSRQVGGGRADYLAHLAEVRAAVRDAAARQRRALVRRHPDPGSLPALVQARSRVWERRPGHPGFLRVRYAVGPRPLSVELVPPERLDGDRVDPAASAAARRLLDVHRVQPDLPLSLDLRTVPSVRVSGDEEAGRAFARSLLCSATALHPPEGLTVAVLASRSRLAAWDWVKWLPHAASPTECDAVGPVRLVATGVDGLAALPARGPAPHLLLVVDDATLPPGHRLGPGDGVTVLDLSPHADPDRSAYLQVEVGPNASARVRRGVEDARDVRVDQCDRATAEAVARRLAPLCTGRTGGAAGSAGTDGPPDAMELFGLPPADRFDPTRAWQPRPESDHLRVPIGVDEDGRPVHLDLKESAQHGMGPHGLVVGATGSGKSELLRTLVLGLAATHSPERLNMVLVDFKGGATFAGMADLPHVSAVITNLSAELTLVDRMHDALSGEMVRRQELLREAGNLASVRDHEQARAEGADLDPLPSLFIVVDEFSELLTARPALLDLFVAIGRLGRSLGLHLLLASQRLEEGRLRGLEAHLSYRVGLRTFSAAESRTVLGVPDAAGLPATPGVGFLRSDATTLRRFTAAYVSGPLPAAAPPGPAPAPAPPILPFTVARVDAPARTRPDPPPRPVAPADDRTVLETAVSQMVGRGPRAHRVWLPPLGRSDTLDRLLADLAPDPELGLVSRTWRHQGRLVVPVGTVDRPREQRRDTLSVDLGGGAGHVAVVGGPRSGKSTLLRTLVGGLALTATPREAQVYVLDLGGGGFAAFAGLPHLAGVATRSRPEAVARVVAEVRGVVEDREALFTEHGIDSVEAYRRQREDGGVDDGYGDVFLVVDGWSTLRADFPDLEPQVERLAARGLTFGVHVVAATGRWADFRSAVRDVLGTRLELHLGDPTESVVDRRAAAGVPSGRPGRGLLAGGLHFLAGLPRIDGDADPDTLAGGVGHLVQSVARAWPGPPGPRLRMLPERVDLATVLADVRTEESRLVLGVDEQRLAPVLLDPITEPHLLVLGDGGSGKTATLRTWLREALRGRTPDQAQVVVVDPRRSLLGEVPEEYLLDHLGQADRAAQAVRELASRLEQRLPGRDVTTRQLRDRSWWEGPEVFVVVDDHDLVGSAQGSPLAALQPLLAQARDIGLHLALARRTGGAARALHEPVIRSLRDLAQPGLLLSGDPAEGPLLGSLKPARAVPGRGRLVTRDRGVQTVQVAWTEPAP